MSRLTEQELTEILDENKGISMVNPNRVYPPLPPAENIMPLTPTAIPSGILCNVTANTIIVVRPSLLFGPSA